MFIIRLIKTSVLLFLRLVFDHGASIVVLTAAVIFIYDGISSGKMCYPLIGKTPVLMTVTKVENRNHRRILPDYVATGIVSNETSAVDVSIFERQFRQLRPGSVIEVQQLPSGKWLNQAKLREPMPIYNLLGLHFAWQFLFGICMLGGWFGLLPWLQRAHRRRVTRGV